MKSQLTKPHQGTYDGIFGHPVARNLHWRDVRAMLAELAEVAEGQNGHLKMIRNGRTLVVRTTHPGNIAPVKELMEIRSFLTSSNMPRPPEPAETG